MDRAKQSGRSEDRRSETPLSSRRTPHTPSRRTSVPLRTGQYKPTSTPAQRVSEDRYRPGSRRTTAEPLRASWKPHDSEADVEEKPARRSGRASDTGGAKLGKFTKLYGWRVYAVPILIVLTVLVVFNTATGPAEPIVSDQQTQAAALGGDSAGGGPSDGGTDVIPENPAKPVDLNIPTAELPEGIPFTQAGQGTFHVIPGKGDQVGSGKLFTYTVDVENGIDPGSYAGDDSFAAAVQTTLSSPQSWTYNNKFALQRVDASFPNPSFRVSLTTPETTHRADMCGYQIKAEASCYRRSEGRVLINLARWVRGAKAFSGDLGLYRQYAINHEVGHGLGGQHVGCPVNGGPAPVMMQQSFGVADDYVSALNNVPGGDKGKVAKDGKVCRPNAWPNTGGN
ncbi:DUF3152 domain-containing protein [Amycolatopsis sp. H20-H5]|uniref:DUF3152 domain-containing protein n=1 Tax=Amycolatopsis sp. H20-H5 TaxID=3046309 RepID=UPI002DB87B72|nr:DUF3152 domain-containing protein [Amycolatopsis sp. H20-H5]MEC3979246.1 DUF3152 domain-containing protein [Amycolatopsis sp. H20-H5]